MNRKRKKEKVGAGEKLQALEEQLYGSLSKNFQIESACQALEQEIAALKERAKEKGIKRTDGETSMDVDGQELKKEDIEEIKKNPTGSDIDGENLEESSASTNRKRKEQSGMDESDALIAKKKQKDEAS